MPPSRLYKYRSLQDDSFRYTQAILAWNTVYLSDVSSFNDPFEGHFRLVMSQGGSPDQQQYEAWANQSFNSRVRAQAAVLSLTEVRDDVLMWSHYAEHHKGICIEFDTTVPGSIFSAAKRVRYLTQFKEVDHGSIRGEDALTQLVCTAKARHWSYENEWRVVEREPGLRNFSPECITGVILGCRISPEYRRWVCGWVASRPTPTRVYEAIQAPDAFALEIRELSDYASVANTTRELASPNPSGQADGNRTGVRSRRLPP